MNCLNCGKTTKVLGDGYAKYCNPCCKDKYWRKIVKKTFKLINCSFCGKETMPRSINGKFCSKECNSRYKSSLISKKPKEKKCSFCEKLFAPYTSLDKFCSANCRVDKMKSKRSRRYSTDSVKRITGKNNPAYIHGQRSGQKAPSAIGLKIFHRNKKKYKQALVDKNGYLWCEICGISGVRFETHHIVYRSEKPGHQNLHDQINMLNVCVPCHNNLHTKKELRNQIVESRKLNEIFGEDILNK